MTVFSESSHEFALEQLRIAMGELFGAERRLRGREQHQARDLTSSQFRALALIDKDNEVTAGEIARSADLNPASVTAMLDLLEARGIVERRRAVTDRRMCLVSLTPKGRKVVEEKRAQWQALWQDRLGHFTKEELVAAFRVMRTMIELLEEF